MMLISGPGRLLLNGSRQRVQRIVMQAASKLSSTPRAGSPADARPMRSSSSTVAPKRQKNINTRLEDLEGHSSAGPPRARKQQPTSQQAERSAPRVELKATAAAAVAAVASMNAPPPSSPAAASEEPEQYPTFVPRNPGVKDGQWNKVDVAIVEVAQKDATGAVKSNKIDEKGVVLLGKSVEELAELAAKYGQPKYRGKQLQDGVLKGARTIEDILTVPKEVRATLIADGVRTGRSILHHSVSSPDGTHKFLLQLYDGRIVECVGIPVSKDEEGDGRNRLTVCVSSQVGCPMRCTFCATGKGGFARNLMPHEIMDQVMTVQEEFGKRVSNVVFMGMGEPLLNLPSVIKSCQLLNQQMGIGARFLTISTVGVPNAIVRLAQQDVKATLAVSIHAPNQALRESIIPSAKAYPLEALLADCTAFYRITGRRVTFEYTLLAGVNDADAHARELGEVLQRHNLLSHVNIIPWNPVDESGFKRPSRNRVHSFQSVLEAAGLTTTIRITRGLEAAAACGQLRNMHQKEPLKEFQVPA